MVNIVFIALQCCQCSTMQVKQQKKSSNKWTCVVCNQKQSVLKVFARGFMAKDIRKFVQSFNMSRKFADGSHNLTADYDASFPEFDGPSAEEVVNTKKRPVDWSEYMGEDDLRGDEIGSGEEGGESEPKVVTEWSDEHLKKPKLKSHSFSHSYTPVFSKRNWDFNCQGMGTRTQSRKSEERLGGEGSIQERGNPSRNPKQIQNLQAAKSTPVPKFGASKREQYITENDDNLLSRERLAGAESICQRGNSNQRQKVQPPSSSKFGASKWDQYIRDDENQFSRDRNCDRAAPDDFGCRCEYDDQVEEDIHPDFL